ncbi:MAG: hypothetical protein P8Z35_03930 [Ignavibacteriaceae bacterium]
MIELPEAAVLADQLNKKIKGRIIKKVIAAQSPHKFAWYQGNPQNYNSLLKGKMINYSANAGGIVEIKVNNAVIALSDGAGLRYHFDDKELPKKHQLLVELDNSTYFSVSIQMYGGILSFKEGECSNKYYLIAKEKPSPVSKKFSEKYFDRILSLEDLQNKSVKFLLATEQRIPGLGNGVLQDILFNAKIHPKRKVAGLSDKDKCELFNSVKNVLADMIKKGGRDTEKDLFGNYGGYATKLSKNTAGQPCINCAAIIKKENYMGGSIYFFSNCQKL